MSNRFEGWYFKQQTKDDSIAFIPAVHRDHNGRTTGSLQIVTSEKAWSVNLPISPVHQVKPELSIRADGCSFSLKGIELDIRRPEVTVTGQLNFGPFTAPKGDIMGPFRFVPGMECRHSVFSMTHVVEGCLTLNGRRLDFTDGIGYIEGDRGRSFPKKYVWTQYSWVDPASPDGDRIDNGRCSLMLSAADVRPFGMPFTGIVGFVYFRGVAYRIATYNGAKITALGNGIVEVKQGNLTLSAQLLEDDILKRHGPQSLLAPVSGNMIRLIKERLVCRARFLFTVGNIEMFDCTTDAASFEYEI